MTISSPFRPALAARRDQPVSAEFKLLLKPDSFRDAKEGVEDYWDKVQEIAGQLGYDSGEEPLPEGERTISFLDTDDFELRDHGYLLRVRKSDDTELTLKYRSLDRDDAAAHDVSSTVPGQTKFEMDVTRRDLFSKSNTIEVDRVPERISDCQKLFPGLDLPDDELARVKDRKVKEKSYKLGRVTLPDGSTAKAGMSLWYDGKHPLLAEFSFRIPLEDGHSGSEPGARRLLEALRERSETLEGTKTDVIYA
ncbi:MAG: hypothetical protein KC910_18945 [Candidatus Eremiobacteraeota bacterium]|nr:hypothetical protein [Candidatus Eremiobacteraeota bacterium]